MKMLSWTLALAATCFLAISAPPPASAATLSGTDVVLSADIGAGFGSAVGTVTDGMDLFNFEVIALFDPLDPLNAPMASLFITDMNFDSYLDGLLQSVEVGADYVALLFGDLMGSGAAMFGSTARVVFTDFALNNPFVTASVTIAPIPLPATALLLLSGMGGVVVVARKRKVA